MKNQKGLVMVFALLVLMSVSILGVSSVASSLLQGRMALSIERKSASFDAAEAAIAGVIFESNNKLVFDDLSLNDPLADARQLAAIDLQNDALSCFDNNRVDRAVTKEGFVINTISNSNARYSESPPVSSWSKTAFIKEQVCRGSSNVIGASNTTCHLFIVRGCGQTEGSKYVIANTLTVAIIAPVAN